MFSKIKKFLLLFSVVFLIASITSFTAFNWSYLSNIQKFLIPSMIMLLGIFLFLLLKQEKYKNLALFFSCFMIGIVFAVFGQIYQTGADSWILFRNWAFFLIIPIIFGLSYAIFSLFLLVNTLMLLFYFTLYFEAYQAFQMACFLPALVLLFYPSISQRWKLHFHEIFYRSLLILMYIFFNFTTVLSIFSIGNHSYSQIYNDSLNIFLVISSVLILSVLFFIHYKVYQKMIILPFSIVSLGIFIWAFLLNSFFDSSLSDPIVYFIVSLLVFLGTLVVLVKTIRKMENDFMKKILNALGIFLKFMIFFFAMGLILVITWSNHLGIFVLGISFLIFSCYFPKFLHFKEDKVEIISFAIGVFALNYFLIQLFGTRLIDSLDFILSLATFNIVLFDIFWYFRASKAMDLVFAFNHYVYIFILCYRFLSKTIFENPLLYVPWIFLLALCILPLQILFEKKIEASKYGYRIHRIFYGSNLCLLFFSLISPSYLFKLLENNAQEYIDISKIVLTLLFSLFVFFSILKKENAKQTLKHNIIFSSLLLILSYLASYTKGAEYIILLLLLSFYRQSKWTTYFLNIILCIHIFYYYYSLSSINLLQKSLYLFLIAIMLLASYVLVKYFEKEVKTYENEAK